MGFNSGFKGLKHKFDSPEALSAKHHCAGETVSPTHSAQGDCLKMKGTDTVYTNSVQQMFAAKGKRTITSEI